MLFSDNDKKEIKDISEEAIEDYEYNTEIIRKEYSRKSLRQDINALTKQVEELAKTVEDLKGILPEVKIKCHGEEIIEIVNDDSMIIEKER